MERNELKRILASISIAGLIAGGGIAGQAFPEERAQSSKSGCGGGSAMSDEEEKMEGQGSSCSGMKQEIEKKEGASSCSGSKMKEEKEAGGSSCSGAKN